MNRVEFINQLEALLADLPQQERMDAISYYNDYLDDAGVENEQEVIAALGSPEQVAETIKAVGKDGGRETGEFSETGFSGYATQKKDEVISTKEINATTSNNGTRSNGTTILLIILAVFGLPIYGGLIIAVLGVVFAFVATVGAVLFSLSIVGIALCVASIATFIASIVTMFVFPLKGIMLMGVSLILAGIGIMLLVAGTMLLAKIIPSIIRGIVNLCKKAFGRGKTVNE